jgi:Family of unknown function (DUF5996)
MIARGRGRVCAEPGIRLWFEARPSIFSRPSSQACEHQNMRRESTAFAAHGDPRQDRDETWPALPYAEWKPTYDTLHMWMQIVGKVKLELTPLLNDWWNIAFAVTPRGLTTSTIPFNDRAFAVDFDFIDHHVTINTTEGRSRRMQLVARPVADFFQEFMSHLTALDIQVEINTLPVEVDNPIRFENDRVHAAYDPLYARRWWRILVSISSLMERYRSPFTGKSSPVNFFWGSFDLATSRYSGRPASRCEWPARWMAIAGEHEYFLAGFWPGNERLPEPAFVAYTYPLPAGCRLASVRADAAYFHLELGEFILPYESVRVAADPDQLVLEFYREAYEIGAALAGWDRAGLERRDSVLPAGRTLPTKSRVRSGQSHN